MWDRRAFLLLRSVDTWFFVAPFMVRIQYTRVYYIGHDTRTFKGLQKGMAVVLFFWATVKLWFGDMDLGQACWPTYKNTPCFLPCVFLVTVLPRLTFLIQAEDVTANGGWGGGRGTIQSVLGLRGTINFKKISRESLNNVAEEKNWRNDFWLMPFFLRNWFKKEVV